MQKIFHTELWTYAFQFCSSWHKANPADLRMSMLLWRKIIFVICCWVTHELNIQLPKHYNVRPCNKCCTRTCTVRLDKRFYCTILQILKSVFLFFSTLSLPALPFERVLECFFFPNKHFHAKCFSAWTAQIIQVIYEAHFHWGLASRLHNASCGLFFCVSMEESSAHPIILCNSSL